MGNYKYTENGSIALKSTSLKVLDMFAFGAAYRKRTKEDCIKLFADAYEEDPTLALKCLFYIRDCRGGQGERRFFRVCFNWLAFNHPEKAKELLPYIAEYGRYDDLFNELLIVTPLRGYIFSLIKEQLTVDMTCEKNAVSLLAKWMPSENASSKRTKMIAKQIREYLGITSKSYRKMLTKLRAKINILETLMSSNRWDEIEYDKIPSKAGLIYKNAFARHDIERYRAFIENKDTKVNAGTLYPYEIVHKALSINTSRDHRSVLNKYWENLPDYLNGANASMICVVDTSGSMWGRPIEVAISLGLYTAERMTGPFANKYISFASRPQLISTIGKDFVDKVDRIWRTNLCDDTNLEAVFDLLLKTAKDERVSKEDIPKTVVVISDMEINYMTSWRSDEKIKTSMEEIRYRWEKAGIEMPKLVYWNVDARNNTILEKGDGISYVSGCSPVIYKSILTGKTGYELMLDTLMSSRYEVIK